MFGAVYANVHSSLPLPAALRGPTAALFEHVALWPLGRVSDRVHPARDRLPRLTGNRAAFLQAIWRHLLFGLVLGELERRLNGGPEPEPEPPAAGRLLLERARLVRVRRARAADRLTVGARALITRCVGARRRERQLDGQ